MLDPFIIDIAAFESGRVDEYIEERAFLDAQLTADGPGWIQFVALDDKRVVRAGLVPEGEQLLVSTSSLRRLGDLRDLLHAAGFRLDRSIVPEPDDDLDFYDDDEHPEHDDDALAAALSAVDALFDGSDRQKPDT